jgi:intracellular multiplication protein IcmV
MGVMKIVKKGVSAGWNVSAWVGAKNIKQNSLLLKDLAQAAFATDKTSQANAPKKETFAQAVRRLNLTEEALKRRIKSSTLIIRFCGALIIPMLIYTLYMFKSGFYLSSFVCLMLTFLAAAYTFREHFNRYQMLQRRLGCTFEEWVAHIFRIKLSRKK